MNRHYIQAIIILTTIGLFASVFMARCATILGNGLAALRGVPIPDTRNEKIADAILSLPLGLIVPNAFDFYGVSTFVLVVANGFIWGNVIFYIGFGLSRNFHRIKPRKPIINLQ